MDILVGIAHIAQVMGLPHLIGQCVRQQVTAGVQPLPHGLGQHGLADPGGQGVDGHDAARQQLPPLRLQHRIGHAAAQQVALHLAVEDICLPFVETGFPVVLIEKGYIQHAVAVHGPHLHQRAPSGDAAGGGVAGQHGPDAGVFTHRQLPDGTLQRPILPPAGKVGQQVAQRGDAQLLQGLGPCLADALDVPDVGVEIGHGVRSR